MGTLIDNLLKLEGFPFSYSFIGLLALISGQVQNFADEEFFKQLGPILILAGFFATTLTIVDPIGYAQRRYLLGWFPLLPRPPLYLREWKLDASDIEGKIKGMGIFGSWVKDQIQTWVLVCLLEDSHDFFKRICDICEKDDNKRKEISEKLPEQVLGNNDLVVRRKLKDLEKKRLEDLEKKRLDIREEVTMTLEEKEDLKKLEKIKLSDLEKDPIYKLYCTLQGLKYRTSTSTWLVREIDKITGLWYFVIVMSAFILAQIFYSPFLAKLSVIPPPFYPIILVLSIVALAAILFMLYFRYVGLKSMGLVTFKFLCEQSAIRTEDKESFDDTLEEIMEFLDEGDWTSAGISVTRLMTVYNDHIKENVKNGEICEQKDKSAEIKFIIKRKNGEMTIEEVKVEEKKENGAGKK
jgi:hypothetical protein